MIEFHRSIQETSKIYEEIAQACRFLLHNKPIAKEAKDYINKRIDYNTQKQFLIGYFPTDEQLPYLFSMIEKDKLVKTNIIYPKYIFGGKEDHGHFHDHNLVMPYYDVYGNVVSLLGRSLLPEEAQKESNLQKYKYSINFNKELFVFGLNLAKKSILDNNCVIVVEGQFDQIALNTVGICNVVATGWANLTEWQFFQIRKYAKNIILMMDNDEAGEKARNKAKRKYSKYANIETFTIPEYKDIDSILGSEDKDLKNLVLFKLKELIQCKRNDAGQEKEQIR